MVNGKFWGLSKLAIVVHQQFWYPFGCFRRRLAVDQGKVKFLSVREKFWTPSLRIGLWQGYGTGFLFANQLHIALQIGGAAAYLRKSPKHY